MYSVISQHELAVHKPTIKEYTDCTQTRSEQSPASGPRAPRMAGSEPPEGSTSNRNSYANRRASGTSLRSLQEIHKSQCYSKSGEITPSSKDGSALKIKHIVPLLDGSSRFPKLDECAHFHYDHIEISRISACMFDTPHSHTAISGAGEEDRVFYVQITCNNKSWIVRRTYENFRMLDKQLHRCVYDRKYSQLTELPKGEVLSEEPRESMKHMLSNYLARFTSIAGSLISCGPILNWLELDNRGNRLLVTDESSAINTPAIAAAHVVKRYTAQAADEISFEVGDIISVIDMPSTEESGWWRGKRGFEVGFFPRECVELIGDKAQVPHLMRVGATPSPDGADAGAAERPVNRNGKLMSFLRSFLTSRPSRRKLKQSGILKERVFGCDLGEHLLNNGLELPMVLKCCGSTIEKHGIVDGIYRLSGVSSNIQKLRHTFDEDRIPDMEDDLILQDIHCVASLLKMYFRELPNPLLTYQLYDSFVRAVQDEDNRLMRIFDVVQKLPPPHYRTLKYLIRHLAKVASHGSETGMHCKNIAIVWAPNLLRSKELESGAAAARLHSVGIQAVVTEFLIQYCDVIFNDKMPSFHSNGTPGPPKRARPKSLAISTPAKLLSLEEARSRALGLPVNFALLPAHQSYIEVGGGPTALPDQFHTVIEFPGKKGKKAKTPLGWKAFFTMRRTPASHKDKSSRGSKSETPELRAPLAVAGLLETPTRRKKLRTV
ncbi:PREDICTED: rho GTPase-activating protein 32-like, partial [Priapulus caudatus]|uniref:Rho GTPase-activating protein 32-like n=1 Tax=Priapulus caudatus TaxID=37621 RepID=A0ABM1DZH3_PRICU